MNTIEAMKQMVEALEKIKLHPKNFWDVDADIAAGRQAIAEAEKQEPVAKAMTAERALYFMERFKHEEKLLGPNEQAAVDFVISMLEAPPQRQPLTDELLSATQMAIQCSYSDHGRRSVNAQAWDRMIQAIAAHTHGITT